MRWTENVGGGRVLRKGAPGPLRPPAKLRVSGDRHAIHLGSDGRGTLRCKSWRQGRGQDMTYRAVKGEGHREAWGQQQNIREVPADKGRSGGRCNYQVCVVASVIRRESMWSNQNLEILGLSQGHSGDRNQAAI